MSRRGGDQVIPRPPAWLPGPPAPWAVLGLAERKVDLADLLGRVRAAGPRLVAPAFEGARLSAVLVALHDGPRGPEVLLTRRARHLSSHRGEVSFPGGRVDPGESPEQAALREAREEVALDPAAVELYGELDHLNTVVSRSYIVPVVGRLAEHPEVRIASQEVERILHVALADLVEPGVYRQELWGAPPSGRAIHFFELDDETIWGATAHMLVELLTVALPP